jgi:hypothetical protein
METRNGSPSRSDDGLVEKLRERTLLFGWEDKDNLGYWSDGGAE